MAYNKMCSKCGRHGYRKFCDNCGGEMVPMTTCNWCGTDLFKFMKYCGSCGRSRHDATTTFPPPPPPSKIRLFFASLFRKTDKNTAEK